MIYFYDRKKFSKIRADPKDVILQIKEMGIRELKESQIKSWWSTYHLKQKQLAKDLATQSRELREQQGDNVDEDAMEDRSDINTESTEAPDKTAIPSSTPIKGQLPFHSSQVIEWSFSESQSDIGGRTGSNACCFIALYMGCLMHASNLIWPIDDNLQAEWKNTFRIAMIKGNGIHDEFLDLDPVNVDVDEGVTMAGDECRVRNVACQIDIYGNNPIGQLEENIKKLADNNTLPFYSIMIAHGRAVLLAINVDKSAMIVDSHRHGSRGAIIGFCKNASLLGRWFDAMLQNDWGTIFMIASLSRMDYVSNA